MAEPFKSDEERDAFRAEIKASCEDKAVKDIRKILNDAGFHPDHVVAGLVDLLIDAWQAGGKWGSSLVMHTFIENGRFNAPEQTIETGAVLGGYKHAPQEEKETDG